jgi:hypothetical protein
MMLVAVVTCIIDMLPLVLIDMSIDECRRDECGLDCQGLSSQDMPLVAILPRPLVARLISPLVATLI